MKKLWAELSYKTANLLVSTGFCLGALPVFWNSPENKMAVVTAAKDKFRYTAAISFMLFWKTGIICAYFTHLYNNGFEPNDASKVFHCLSSGTALFLGLFDLHTARNFDEFVSFINKSVAYYEYFQSKSFICPSMHFDSFIFTCNFVKMQ